MHIMLNGDIFSISKIVITINEKGIQDKKVKFIKMQ